MNVEFLMAVRDRLAYQGREQLAAAIDDKPDTDELAQTEEDLYALYRGDSIRTPLEAVELKIAELVDDGASLPISNPEGFQAAQWITSLPVDQLPDPVPRTFALYLAYAYKMRGTYPTLNAALTEIQTSRTIA